MRAEEASPEVQLSFFDSTLTNICSCRTKFNLLFGRGG